MTTTSKSSGLSVGLRPRADHAERGRLGCEFTDCERAETVRAGVRDGRAGHVRLRAAGPGVGISNVEITRYHGICYMGPYLASFYQYCMIKTGILIMSRESGFFTIHLQRTS
ncbi:hypothetical protein BN903_96 [Halorubrum sp. AJ67]|nr:hypothetical protein BN903_96 [Halorubrum sp. AJ67]